MLEQMDMFKLVTLVWAAAVVVLVVRVLVKQAVLVFRQALRVPQSCVVVEAEVEPTIVLDKMVVLVVQVVVEMVVVEQTMVVLDKPTELMVLLILVVVVAVMVIGVLTHNLVVLV
jgi:hypothetical protein